MKSTFKYRLVFLGLLVSLISISSCSNNESYDFWGDSGKVYVRLQSSNMVNSVANVCETKVIKTLYGTFGKDGVIAFPINATMPVKGLVKATLGIDNSLIAAYNAENNTEYKSLAASLFSVNRPELTIVDGQMQSKDSIEFVLKTEKLSSLEIGDYLVPITLLNVIGNMEVSSNWKTIFLHVAVVDDPYGVPAADRLNWKVIDFSAEELDGEIAPASNVLDGNTRSIWHTPWYRSQPAPPHYITIDMNKVANMAGFQYVTRDNGFGCPLAVVVEISTDNENWEEVGHYEQSELPIGASQECKKFFKELKEARYFRLTILKAGSKGWGGNINTSYYTCVAEINAFLINSI